jgi:hypothetical protein
MRPLIRSPGLSAAAAQGRNAHSTQLQSLRSLQPGPCEGQLRPRRPLIAGGS